MIFSVGFWSHSATSNSCVLLLSVLASTSFFRPVITGGDNWSYKSTDNNDNKDGAEDKSSNDGQNDVSLNHDDNQKQTIQDGGTTTEDNSTSIKILSEELTKKIRKTVGSPMTERYLKYRTPALRQYQEHFYTNNEHYSQQVSEVARHALYLHRDVWVSKNSSLSYDLTFLESQINEHILFKRDHSK